MSIHLVGGGDRPGEDAAVYGAFVAECAARVEAAGEERQPRVALLTVREGGDPGHGENLTRALARAGSVEVLHTVVAEGERMPAAAIDGADGILVGGGLTPAYLDAIQPLKADIRTAVEAGTPYLGFSAGAAIAPDRALLGGWRIDGVEVCDREASEDLDELTIVDGLGLIDVTVDVHAAQWGTLTRAIAAVDSGAVGEAVAIDESTVLVVGTGPLRVAGAGTVWVLTRDERGVLVRSMR
ncbi:MAG: Type 1 glutamine amidotransferase-like domain-containing protein [Humibacter sp.]